MRRRAARRLEDDIVRRVVLAVRPGAPDSIGIAARFIVVPVAAERIDRIGIVWMRVLPAPVEIPHVPRHGTAVLPFGLDEGLQPREVAPDLLVLLRVGAA